MKKILLLYLSLRLLPLFSPNCAQQHNIFKFQAVALYLSVRTHRSLLVRSGGMLTVSCCGSPPSLLKFNHQLPCYPTLLCFLSQLLPSPDFKFIHSSSTCYAPFYGHTVYEVCHMTTTHFSPLNYVQMNKVDQCWQDRSLQLQCGKLCHLQYIAK